MTRTLAPHVRRAVTCVVIGAACLAACGKKGPPLAPFVRVPAAVSDPVATRIGGDVFVSFTVPAANADGRQPSDIREVRVYAVTATTAPDTEERLDLATLIATVPVRAALPPVPAAPDGTPLPPLPVPPGVERGAKAVVRETITPALLVPVEMPPTKSEARALAAVVDDPDAEAAPVALPLVAPPPTALPRRHYVAVGVSTRGRLAAPSPPVSIPLETGSLPPGAPEVSYTESDLTVTWPPSPDARTSTFVPEPAPAVAAGPAPGAAGAPALPPVPPPPPVLVAKSLGFNSQATTYHLYEPAAADAAGAADALPVPLTPQPIPGTTHVIKGVTFGVERCFFVRPVDDVFGSVVQGPASPTTCVTPADTFPPAAPRALAAIGSAGVISLIWEPNGEADLAGYLVLRGEAPGDTLQALTPAPITVTSYRDTAIRPGVRYVYAVVAVDRADPPNTSPRSNVVEETGRQ